MDRVRVPPLLRDQRGGRSRHPERGRDIDAQRGGARLLHHRGHALAGRQPVHVAHPAHLHARPRHAARPRRLPGPLRLLPRRVARHPRADRSAAWVRALARRAPRHRLRAGEPRLPRLLHPAHQLDDPGLGDHREDRSRHSRGHPARGPRAARSRTRRSRPRGRGRRTHRGRHRTRDGVPAPHRARPAAASRGGSRRRGPRPRPRRCVRHPRGRALPLAGQARGRRRTSGP